MSAKMLVAFDFDHTLIDDNSDLYVRKLAPGGKLPQHIKTKYKPDGWTDYMGAIFRYLHENNVTRDEILDCMREIPFVKGIMDLLEELRKEEYEVVIISDSNSEFIKCIMEAAKVDDIVHTTYTNPAYWDAYGCLHIEFYHTQDWCNLSTRNLCKGHILEEHIKKAKVERNISFSHVVYVGDGTNDLCPSLRLKKSDVTCPRIGFSLAKEIDKLEDGKMSCQVLPWDTGTAILEYITKLSTSRL